MRSVKAEYRKASLSILPFLQTNYTDAVRGGREVKDMFEVAKADRSNMPSGKKGEGKLERHVAGRL